MTNRCRVCRRRWQSEVSDGIFDQPIAGGPYWFVGIRKGVYAS
jgi:hypothetical protein